VTLPEMRSVWRDDDDSEASNFATAERKAPPGCDEAWPAAMRGLAPEPTVEARLEGLIDESGYVESRDRQLWHRPNLVDVSR